MNMNVDAFTSDSVPVFALIVAGFFALCVLIFGKSSRHRLRAHDHARILSAWQKVTRDIQPHEAHWRNAVVQADAVLDMALRARRFAGDTMAKRMSRAARKYPEIEEAFRAHRLRNDLVHNPERSIEEKEYRWALRVFERTLRALGM